MRFVIVILLSALLVGCIGADGKVHNLVVQSEEQASVTEKYEEHMFRKGVAWACIYASVNQYMRQGYPSALIPDMAADNCTGFDDKVWDSYQKVQEEEEEKSTSDLFEELGITLENS